MIYQKWVGNDLWNIVNLPLDVLVTLYKDHNRNKLRILKNYHLKRGNTVERSEPYNPETEAERIATRKSKVGGVALAHLISPEDRQRYHDRLDEALDEYGSVSEATFWQMGYVQTRKVDGNTTTSEAASHPLHRFKVEFNNEPKWPTVQRVESELLPKKEAKVEKGSKTAFILPDMQIPFEDARAIDIVMQAIQDQKPDKVILLGDALDLSAWSKYEQRPEYATATQDAVIKLHKLLATIRKMVPSADITMLAGNHEARMERSLLRNAQAAYGIKRADALEGWPVMSVPFLCAFDTLGVEYVDGYPANRLWINERLQVRHGNIARPGGKTAVAIANDEKVSTIFGHIHRIESQFKTVNVYDGGRTSAAYGIGCLCRIDGHVPSMKSAHDGRTGQPITNFENWQLGFAKVSYEEGDGPFSVEQAYINNFSDYETRIGGKTYRAGDGTK